MPTKTSRKVASNKAKPKTVEEYFETVPPEAVPALKALRAAIKAAAPSAEEIIAMGVPAYRQNGLLVSFAAAAKHCSLYVMSPGPLSSRKEALRDYDLAPTAIRFSPETRLPKALVADIVRERIRENETKKKA